jgi:iron complex transport system permease protein
MRRARIAGLLAFVAVSLVLGLGAGTVPLGPGEVWRGLWSADAPAAVIVRELRLPRVLLAFLVGGSLAVCGAALQAMIRNPLAEPYLLGLSGGAGLGAVLALASRAAGPWAVPVAAFAGALAAVGLVYQPRRRTATGSQDPAALGGSGGRLRRRAHERDHRALRRTHRAQRFLWLLGGFGAASWQALAVFAAYAVVPLAAIGLSARALDLVALGDEPAHHLGADVDRVRRLVYVCTALLTAASVAACGIIGFVGLVVPHAVRTLARPLHRTLLPLAFAGGGSFLVLADVVVRTVARPLELPVGVITALVGVPIFAVLLRRSVA